MTGSTNSKLTLLLVSACVLFTITDAGVIKDLFHKITNTNGNNDRPEGADKSSALICGGGLFKSSDEKSLSPEIIFITNRPSRASSSSNHGSHYNNGRREQRERREQDNNEVAREFSFHEENVTLADLERYGFNPDAPVSFLIHGFTSGYPLQAWMSAIVEAYTIDRHHESHNGRENDHHSSGSSNNYDHHNSGSSNNYDHHDDYASNNHHQSGSGDHSHGYNGNQHGGSGHQGNQNHYEHGDQSYTNSGNYHSGSGTNHHNGGNHYNTGSSGNHNGFGDNQWGGSQFHRRDTSERNITSRRQPNFNQGKRVSHNLFIVNWNYAARGILYPRAVANIPLVASYLARFINEKLLDEARIDPTHIQLIGHSLGAHLAGFTAKNTRERMGRIYGLDPAGPCFGSIAGSLFPASKRLDPSDAEEVITIHTNYALLGIEKAIGRYSVYVEGGKSQPGCKAGGPLKTLTTLTIDQASADSIACSHSRAPNLLTYRHDQSDHDDDCQLIAYECKDWDAYTKGHCGVCQSSIVGSDNEYSRSKERGRPGREQGPLRQVECLRVGLDWQYPKKGGSGGRTPVSSNGYQRPNQGSNSNTGYDDQDYNQSRYNRTTRRPNGGYSTGSSYDNNGYGTTSRDEYNRRTSTRRPYSSSSSSGGDYGNNDYGYSSQQSGIYEQAGYNGRSTRRPGYSSGGYDRNRRASGSNATQSNSSPTEDRSTERRGNSESIKPVVMFLKTGDTQPYCTFQYQVVLELNEPFKKSEPPMSLVLQDSESNWEHQGGQHQQSGGQHHQSGGRKKNEQNSIVDDEFGRKYDDRFYTKLVTSNQKLKKIDHATLLFRLGLPDGHRILKALHINYMSHIDPNVRRRLSSTLCPVRTDQDRGSQRDKENADTRFYFKPCQ